MTVGGTVRGITRLFGGVPRRRDPGQRSMYEKMDFNMSTLQANIAIVVRLHLPGRHRCMFKTLSWASNPILITRFQRIETH